MPARRIVQTVLIGCLLSLPLGARSEAPLDPDRASLEVSGPPAGAPTRLLITSPSPGKSSDPSALLEDAWRADAFALGLAPGLVPPARVLDPLPERSALAASDPVAASLQAIGRHPALTGLAADELELAATRETPKINVVHFRQRIDGLPVLGSKITLGWDRAGRLRLAGSTVYLPGPLDGARRLGPPPPPAWIPQSAAETAALAGFPGDVQLTGWETAERAWLPTAAGSTPVRFLPAWHFRFHTASPDGWWEARVHGETGELIDRHSLICDIGADAAAGSIVHGRVSGWIEPMTAGDPLEERPFPNQSLELRSSTSLILGTTDAAGEFALEGAGPGEYTLHATLSGKYIRVVEESREGSTPAQSQRVTLPGEVDLVWEAPVSPEARDVYRHANVAHDVVRARDDGPALDPLDQPIDVVIDAPIGPVNRCNAWWDGTALWFHRASTWCISFARIAGVVYHEYGHAVTSYLGGGLIGPGYLAEGWSDYFAATIMNDPRIGLGFMGPGTMFRDIDYNRVWPDDASWDPHFQGLIIASTLWDLRQILGPAQTDSLFHYAIYGAAQTHEEYLLDLLAWDDDDGEIENGTPHFDQIVSTFRAHGIADDGVYLAFDPVDDPLEGPGSIELQATIRSPIHAVDADSSMLFVRRSGEAGFTAYPLIRVGRTRTYRAAFPLPAAGGTVDYYWRGVNAYGRTGYLPSGAPDATFSFRVRADLVAPAMTHVPAGAVAAGTNGHWLRARVRDNSDCVRTVVGRYRLAPDGEEQEIALDPIGDGLYSVRLPLGPLVAGQRIEYALTAVDCAGRPNQTTVPSIGTITVPVRGGSGIDLEREAGPLQAEGDWAWGVPSDPALAYSGTHCWGTDLLGRDEVVNSSDLVWGPIDLRLAERASLRLRHALRIESEHAGARVEVATSPVPSWRPLEPDGGYAATGPGEMGPCFGGATEESEEVAFPLDALLGRKVWFRFHYVNDGADGGRGWFLDDLRLLQEQVRARPTHFEAVSGQNRQVTLRWQPPVGIDPTGRRFLGYRLYRTLPGSNYLRDPLVELPPAAETYIDRSLQNGVTYRYRLHAVYDEGESIGLERDAMPNPGQLALEETSVDLVLSAFAPIDTTARLRNSGRGELVYQLFAGPPAAAITDVRVSYEVQPGDEAPSITVTPDPDDAVAAPDLAAVDARQWADSTGRMLEIGLRGREAWGSPAHDWGGVVFFDTDLDLSTGVDAFGTAWTTRGGIGADWLVAFGTAAASLGLDGTRAWLVRAGESSGEELAHADLITASDRLRFSVPLGRLGDPAEVQLAVFVGLDPAQPANDRVPEAAPAWLSRRPLRARLEGGARGTFTVAVDGAGLPNGTYSASIVLDSNDPDTPWRRLPIHLRVDRDFPEDLRELSFRSMRAGLEGTFRLRPEVRPDTVDVERRNGGEWRPLAHSLAADAGGRYLFFDRQAATEDSSTYRIRVVEDDRRHYYGPFAANWDFTPPAIEAPHFVSAEEGIEGTLFLSAGLGDVRAIRAERRGTTATVWTALTLSAPDTTRRVRFLDRWSLLRSDTIRPDEAYLYRFQIDTAAEDSLSYGPYECTFVPPVPAALALHPPRPTPFRDRALLRFDLPRSGPVRLEVFDAQGRRRVTLVHGALDAGIHQVEWNGRDANGYPLPAGAYWLRLVTNQGLRTVRTVRFR